jgi:hypothetical protein
MKVAYVTTYDASDVGNWSGLPYFMGRALEQQAMELVYVGSLNTYADSFIRVKELFYRHIVKKGYHADREPRILMSYANQVVRRLQDLNVNDIFSPGSIPILICA